ncbi:MAG: hypothetical protein FWG61_04185 [Firmicutes bacterium]|nr:hypothetical protein [Bacillota bacterium]
MRKDIIFLIALIILCLSAAASATDTTTAAPTTASVLVDGKNIAFDAYNIAGNNYFKLRDLAYTISGSPKQFEVGWDSAQNAISLTSGQPYTTVGGEMQGKGSGEKEALPTTSKIFLDGREVKFTAYNIGGNNYFKLRDIGQALDFGVGWDDTARVITIDTSTGYTYESIAINETNFSDPIFRSIVAGPEIDKNQDGVLSADEIAMVRELDLSEMDIASLQGIEFFSALTVLNCNYNQLTDLDVSKNINLNSLSCSKNQLTVFDVSKNINLKQLDCRENQLTELDVRTNINLEFLGCVYNQLTALDTSNNINLKRLDCIGSQLTALDISKNINLESLDCDGNQLTDLDVSKTSV